MTLKVNNDIKNKTSLSKPNMYAVIMHNDDYTTMDFVVAVLIKIFHKTKAEAYELMMQVHKEGKSVVCICPYDIAVTKCIQAEKYAEQNEFPLRISVEIA